MLIDVLQLGSVLGAVAALVVRACVCVAAACRRALRGGGAVGGGDDELNRAGTIQAEDINPPWTTQVRDWARAQKEGRGTPLDSYSLVANDEIAETFGLNSTLHGDERDAVFGQARYRATD